MSEFNSKHLVKGITVKNALEHNTDNSLSSCLHQGEIHRVRSDGTNRTEFAPAAILGSPVGLALDWLTENLYYTNPATQSIEVRQIILCPVVVVVVFTVITGFTWHHPSLFFSFE